MEFDAIVIGAGIAGLGVSVRLSRSGLKVACIDPEPFPHAKVGESLDWSAPALLADLGISRDQLVADGVATYKKELTITGVNKEYFIGFAPSILAKRPFKSEILTFHVDRAALDQSVYDQARESGVHFIWARVTAIDIAGGQIKNVHTSDGQTLSATWFVDASGQSRLFARKFEVPRQDFGRRKIALWTHFDNPDYGERTNLYTENPPGYLSWIWEIPIRPTTRSVGLIISADKFKELNRAEKSVEKVFLSELLKFQRFRETLPKDPDLTLFRCSYQTYVHEYACGPNWFMIGEAAAMPDPLSANGVTAALRHGKEVAASIEAAQNTGEVPAQQRGFFNTNVKRMGLLGSYHFEETIYLQHIRRGLNPYFAALFLTLPNFGVNALYSKYTPRSTKAIYFYGWVFLAVRLWRGFWGRLAKWAFWLRQFPKK